MINNQNIVGAYVGAEEVVKFYLGTDLLYEATSPEPDPCEGMGEEECECVQNGGTWVIPEIGDPYCEQGGEVDCEGDPECLCGQAGGVWTYDDMTDTYYCDCGGDPECECISAGGEWDGNDCVYPE